jgi:hypothetical protein
MFVKLFSATLPLLAVGALAAADLQDNVGIGLGTLLFEGHDGLVSQISAATTNGSCGNQTFAITSGTLGATRPDSFFAKNEQLRNFVKDNMDALASDMAAGSGETLDALAELMLVPAADRAAFSKTLQDNFGAIYSAPNVTHTEVIDHLAKVVDAA